MQKSINNKSEVDEREVSKIRKSFKKFLATNEITTLIFLFILVVITSSINPNFLNSNNIRAMARGMSFMMISAVGVTLTVLVGKIDIAVGSVAGFSGIMVTYLATQFDIPLIPAVIIIEIPLPIPTSVICSPSHIKKVHPVVKVMTVINRNAHPGLITNDTPDGLFIASKPKLIPKD